MSFLLQDIVPIINAKLEKNTKNLIFSNVSIDSRSLQNNNETIFFAIKGPNNNGHNYIEELIKKGVRFFVVSEDFLIENSNCTFLKVTNTLTALQNFAAYYRKQFHFPIIGITGSNGKTIVKEWLNFLLNPDYNIIRSPKSYNSQVGVPLSVLAINEKHNLGIFEAGISTTNEMQNLNSIIQPTIGILTNIGSAHDEGFENVSQKIKEKLKLFKGVSCLILNKNKTIEAFLNKDIKTFTWSTNDRKADVHFQQKIIEKGTTLNVTFKQLCFKIKVPFSDEASLENVMQCVLVMLYFKYSETEIEKRIIQLYPIEMRLKVKKGNDNCILIDDSYSSDFQSLKLALDFLENQGQHKKKTLILSDIYQSGLNENELYSRVSQLLLTHKITRVIAVGETISKFKSKFLNVKIFASTKQLIEQFDSLTFSNETILIKGSRNFQFEKIVSLLEEKTHETVFEINLNAISHNLNFYKSKLAPNVKMMVMVKAFGYGNGGFEIAKLLAHHKVDYLGVAFADEGIALRKAGIDLPIMVLNPEMTSFEAIIQYKLEPEIYNLKGLNAFTKLVDSKKINNYPIHIKINTGMNRLGFDLDLIPELIQSLLKNKKIEVKSILSHLAASEDLNLKDFTNTQIKLFKNITKSIQKELQIKAICHIANTSGISNFPEAQMDMVRLGIGLYGISNNPIETIQLETVGTLKSVISQIRTLNKAESVGYNRRFMVKTKTIVATIPIGYADGIFRSWGNEKGYVLINNQKANILGSICMDMLMVDVTNIQCVEGNEVIVFGKNPSVVEIANALNTIPYEILTSISNRVKRIFYRE